MSEKVKIGNEITPEKLRLSCRKKKKEWCIGKSGSGEIKKKVPKKSNTKKNPQRRNRATLQRQNSHLQLFRRLFGRGRGRQRKKSLGRGNILKLSRRNKRKPATSQGDTPNPIHMGKTNLCL